MRGRRPGHGDDRRAPQLSSGPFTVDDFELLSGLAVAAWRSGLDRDWSVPAGTLEWSCFDTADHTVDCVFSYALMFASRRRDSYLEFSELHPLPGTGPIELVDGLRAVTTMLSAVIRVAPADTRAIIWRRPVPETGSPDDFAARGGLELILHARDVCRGLEVAFDPPRDVCERLRDHTQHWPGHDPIDVTDDPWSDVLRRSGRPSN